MFTVLLFDLVLLGSSSLNRGLVLVLSLIGPRILSIKLPLSIMALDEETGVELVVSESVVVLSCFKTPTNNLPFFLLVVSSKF